MQPRNGWVYLDVQRKAANNLMNVADELMNVADDLMNVANDLMNLVDTNSFIVYYKTYPNNTYFFDLKTIASTSLIIF